MTIPNFVLEATKSAHIEAFPAKPAVTKLESWPFKWPSFNRNAFLETKSVFNWHRQTFCTTYSISTTATLERKYWLCIKYNSSAAQPVLKQLQFMQTFLKVQNLQCLPCHWFIQSDGQKRLSMETCQHCQTFTLLM